MKTKLALIAVSSLLVVLGYTNCAKNDDAPKPPPETVAGATPTPAPVSSCSYTAGSRAAKAITYGAFDPSTMDSCGSFSGTTSRWTGMPSTVALVALPTSFYASGASCGACVEVEGPAGKVVGRVATVCSGCADNEIDMNLEAFTAVTGAIEGKIDVTVKPVACTVTEGVRVTMSNVANPFYLSLSPSNYRHPVSAIQVNAGSGFVAMNRLGNTNTFEYASPVETSGSVEVKMTDVFGQTIQATINSNADQSTLTTQQFGNCESL